MCAGLDVLRVAYVVLGEDDIVRYANAHVAFVFPDVPTPVGLSFADLIRSARSALAVSPETVLALRSAKRAERDPLPVDVPMADGRVFSLKERPLPDGGAALLFSDETAVRVQTSRMEDAIEASTDGFAFFDAAGRLALCNDGFAHTLGGAEGLEIGDTFGLILARARTAGRVSINGDPPPFDVLKVDDVRRDFHLTHQDGRSLRLRIRVARAGGVAAVLTDVGGEALQRDTIAARGAALAEANAELRESRRRLRMQTASLLGLKEELSRAQDDAVEADRAKQAFLRTMSHELRTPLNSIIGFSEILEQELFGPVGAHQYKDYAGLIRESGRRLLRIINRILEITRLEAGVSHLDADRESAGEIARRAVAAFAAQAERIEVDLAVEAMGDLPDVWGDAAALRAVFDNLLANAIAHTPPGGLVRVTGQATHTHVTIFVTDTGVGIPAHDLERVMLPFEQGGPAANAVGDGAGLGLPIVKAFIDALGGAFELVSHEGRGTQAAITLPRADAPREAVDRELDVQLEPLRARLAAAGE